MENQNQTQNIFTFLISKLKKKNKIISSIKNEEFYSYSINVLQKEEEEEEEEELYKKKLLKDSLELPRYNCKNKIKCKDFDMDKVNFINFNFINKTKIVPLVSVNVSKKNVDYCDMV
jgi:hypothetical protein